jgi:predicted ester cyclase
MSYGAITTFIECINTRNFGRLDECLSDDWIDHLQVGCGTKSEFVKTVQAVISSFPDFEMHPEFMRMVGDHVFVRSRLLGTHSGAFAGLTATGQRIDILSHDLHRLKNGEIIESWQLEDWFSAYKQLGGLGS